MMLTQRCSYRICQGHMFHMSRTDTYGTQSAKYHCIIDWNNFKKTFSNLSPAEHKNPKIKALLKKHFSNKYWSSLEKHYHKTTVPLWKTSVSPSQTLLFFRTVIYYYYHKQYIYYLLINFYFCHYNYCYQVILPLLYLLLLL